MSWLVLASLARAQSAPSPEQLACESGVGRACGALGDAYWRGDGVPKDVFRATQLFRSGCDLGDADSCMFLAEAYRTGVGTRTDQQHAVDLYTRACSLGDPVACRSVGDLLTMGVLGTVDGQSAGVWYAKGCEGGDAQACTAAGLWVERGDGMLPGHANGLRLFQQGCEGGHRRACGLLGERYLRGADGAKKDLAAAYQWYARGCQPPEDPVACRELGAEMLVGRWVPADRERGIALLDRSCYENDGAACGLLAQALLSQKGWTEALVAGERGCDLGDGAACRAAERARFRLTGP
jgi:TPR repeat protein